MGSTVAMGTMVGLGAITAPALAETEVDYPPIIDNLVSKFNLNPEEVSQVFQDTRKHNEEERLTQLVTDGKITEEQKTYIAEHQEEMMQKREELEAQGKTKEEIREEMEADMDEFRDWLEEQDIDMPFGGHGMRGERMEGDMGEKPFEL